MNSHIYHGHVEHARLHPVVHRFRNPVTFYSIDLEDIDALDNRIPDFAHNRFATLSLHDKDYLRPGPEPVREKLRPWIEQLALPAVITRVTLVTALRWFGRVFNPVSFYLLEDAEGEIRGMIAEVNNTFGDRHVYPVCMVKPEPALLSEGGHEKEFHVSPFNNMEGSYQFTLRRDAQQLYIGVDLYRGGHKIIETWIEGEGRPLTRAEICRERRRHPLRAWLTMPRIVWQAMFLKFKHKLPVHKRPEPAHPHTLLSRKRPR
jgi:cyclopropane-fatty-acyl-phospholipid synthase